MSNVMLGGDNNMYTWGANGLGQFMSPNLLQNPGVAEAWLKRGLINPVTPSAPQQAAPAPQQSMTPQGPQAFQDKLNRLTINASDALYGGLLGYNPKPITSPTGNQYQPPNPQGGFRFPFGLLNGMGGQQ